LNSIADFFRLNWPIQPALFGCRSFINKLEISWAT